MAAPRGNKFAVGNNGGRPPIYESVKEMAGVIDEYFQSCEPKIDEQSKQVTVEPPSVAGLTYFLGFESRTSLYDYKDREEFMYMIKRALLRVEMHYESRLNYNNPTGAIFALKNMGWADRQELENSGEIKITVEEKRIS